MDLRQVTDHFAVAPQLSADDIVEAGRLGFRLLVVNRPDGEGLDQLSWEEAEAAARAAGMRATFAPFQGAPTVEAIAAVQQALSSGEGPVLAYCRSGTRSITAWAIAMAESRQLDPDAILLAARVAGYDLAALKDLLRSVAEG